MVSGGRGRLGEVRSLRRDWTVRRCTSDSFVLAQLFGFWSWGGWGARAAGWGGLEVGYPGDDGLGLDDRRV